MTEDEMNERLQLAQDMIDTLTQQRDGANNTVVQLNARVKQLERQIARNDEAKIAAPALASNGHDVTAAAH